MPDFVIVGSDGTEHHFPEGMDPKAAIQVVRNGELKAANAKPLSEPTTYEAGHKKSLDDTVSRTGSSILKGLVSSFTGGSSPEPTRESLLAGSKPSFDPAEAGRTVLRGVKQIGSNLSTPEGGGEAIGQLLGGGAVMKASDALPKVTRAGAASTLRTVSDFDLTHPFKSTLGKVVEHLETPPEPQSAPPRLAGKAPTLSEVLQSALEQNMSNDPAKASTSADVVPTGGMQKPKVGKRPGGYTTNIPARPGYEAPVEGEAAVAPEGVQRSPSDTRSTGKADKMADTASGTDSLEELLNALHGEDSPLAINAEGHGTAKPFFNAREVSGIQGKTGQMLPSQDLAEEAASLRRMKGSRDAGSAMFPDLTPAERGGLVKKLAPGPSRIPLEAEARINAAAQKAKGDIPSLLLAMLTGGGGALAARQTVPDSTLGLPE